MYLVNKYHGTWIILKLCTVYIYIAFQSTFKKWYYFSNIYILLQYLIWSFLLIAFCSFSFSLRFGKTVSFKYVLFLNIVVMFFYYYYYYFSFSLSNLNTSYFNLFQLVVKANLFFHNSCFISALFKLLKTMFNSIWF